MAGVRTKNPKYDELSPKWQRCSDVVDGQDALHEGGEKYLPRLKDETEADYKARKCRSDFYNATWRTISGLTGMAFRKQPVTKVPPAIEPYLGDIDLAGCSLDDMAKHLVEDMIEYGAFGLMVDYPPAPENVQAISLAIAQQLGLRPLVQYYEIESVINWRYIRRNNATVLGLVVLQEEAQINDDYFSHMTEPRYRVLDFDDAGYYRQRIFRVDEYGNDEQVGADIYPLMNAKPMTYIPFKIVGDLDEPPLIDLVDANIAHYQINSDYRHGLHFTGLPTAVVSGYQPETSNEKLYIGSQAAWVFPDPNAQAKFLEFTGQGLTEIREALKALEQRMAVLGARMIADETKQVETATGTQIKRAGENSVLASLTAQVSGAIEWALGIMAEWASASGDVSYQINRDYNPAMLDAQQLTALLALVQAGEMSSSEFYQLLQRVDMIDSGKPYDEHQAEVEIQNIPRPIGTAA